MRRPLATVAVLLATGLPLLTGACTDRGGSPAGVRESCQEYTRLLNDWSAAYGAELGAVGQASAAGDHGRRDTAVPVVRELFLTTADGLAEQAGRTADRELAEALTEAAAGLREIAGQIETYRDVAGAPALMSDGRFAEAGERVSASCAG
jgi:hypothetical protein